MFKTLRKIHKRQKGFTLVEVIVVAVIVAVLAAVAIPIYLNYVATSKTNQSENLAGAIASFAGACATSGGALDPAPGAGPMSVGCDANAATILVPDGFTCADGGGSITCVVTDASAPGSSAYTY